MKKKKDGKKKGKRRLTVCDVVWMEKSSGQT